MNSTLAPAPDLDYAVFVRRVLKRTGIDLRSYKRKQMERRLRSLALRYGASTLAEFYAKLDADPSVLEEFRKRVTINVSELLRNPDKFDELGKKIIPRLPSRAPLKVWSAGCSYGAEAYSVAILACESSRSGDRTRILATDVDEEMLARGREGLFSESDMKNVSPARRRRFFTPENGCYRIRPETKQMISFQHHDLLRDKFPSDLHLILCRNVVIYFTEEAKQRLFREFFESLQPGGVLFIGSTERILDANEIGFEHLSPFFYLKPLADGRE